MMKYMAEAGLRPLLVEWRDPLVHEFSFAVEDYITARLEPLLAYVHERFPARRPYLLGYCMGGLLAIAAAVRKPQFVRGVIMLATPWDFHCREYEPLRLPNIAKEILEKQNGENLSPLPGAWVQALFYALYPNVVAQKFKNLALAARDEESAKTRAELEYWVNDGVAMTHPVARDCLNIWLSENQPARGLWKVCGVTIRPEEISCPGFFALPTRDYIVPLSSSSLLASQMTRSPLNVITPFAGHVGMVVGSRADELLWKPMLTWALTQQAV
jgi:poly(3-hydroxyalkanoate) synthetase